jgi:CDGSH-type Zn-finger protein/truncated hemoglobin YjbI
MSVDGDEPRITVTANGPYRISGAIHVYDAEGNLLRTDGIWHLCRCGGSRNKPFCDATHGLKGFDGTEAADHDVIANRRDSYPAGASVTVYDDRSRCAHFGQCTSRLPSVFRAAREPFVDPTAAPAGEITQVVPGCPSGALAYADPSGDPAEEARVPAIKPIVDGPYRIEGAIQVVGADGTPYERRARQTLCRCGQSRNKPFCDGSHWYAGFRDPLPPELVKTPPTVYEWLGGLPALKKLTEVFYAAILTEPDPILEPVFRGMDPEHPLHVAIWLAETFGGPTTYTERHGGYENMLAKHRNRGLTEEQRAHWVAKLVSTADQVGLPADPNFRSTFVAYVEWGSRLALANSQPDAAVIEHSPVPKWHWGQTPPFDPQPWDDPSAAEAGRRRYAAEQQKSHRERRTS